MAARLTGGMAPRIIKLLAESGMDGPTHRDWRPCYPALEQSGELAKRVNELKSIYESCHLCPRQCRVNRLKGELGICRSTAHAKVSAAHPHFGEEAALS